MIIHIKFGFVVITIINCMFIMCLSLLLLEQSALEHYAFVSVVSSSLCVFLAVFILVCTEILSQKWRHLLGLIIWATHLTMGYTFIFTGPIVVPWDQVKSFRFAYFFFISFNAVFLFLHLRGFLHIVWYTRFNLSCSVFYQIFWKLLALF